MKGRFCIYEVTNEYAIGQFMVPGVNEERRISLIQFKDIPSKGDVYEIATSLGATAVRHKTEEKFFEMPAKVTCTYDVRNVVIGKDLEDAQQKLESMYKRDPQKYLRSALEVQETVEVDFVQDDR